MKELKSCGVLVVRGEPIESFLLMVHPDRFDLPKGHLDAGETEVECALRELEEETGIRAEDVALAPDFRFTLQYRVRYGRSPDEEREKTLVIFLGRLLREIEIQPTEHPSYQWVRWSPPHAIQLETIDPLLAELARYCRAGR